MSEERIYIPPDMRERFWDRIVILIGASLVGAGIVYLFELFQ
jgi:hypothetical protein